MLRRPPISTLFPTRRSSDLKSDETNISKNLKLHDFPSFGSGFSWLRVIWRLVGCGRKFGISLATSSALQDRKSTRLNSSHSQISYAVFCLKKKRTNINKMPH